MAEHMRALLLKSGDRVVLRGKPGTVNRVEHAGSRVRLTVQLDGASAITTTLTGETLVETLNYQPRRGDEVERWLERRLTLPPRAEPPSAFELLMEYRAHAAAGVPLGTSIPLEDLDA